MFSLLGSKPQINSTTRFYKPAQKHLRQAVSALYLILTLTVLPIIVLPFLGEKGVNFISNTGTASAEECSGGTCG